MQIFNWIMWLTSFVCIIYSKLKGNPEVIVVSLVIVLIRNCVPLLDFDGKRFEFEQDKLNFYMLTQMCACAIIQACINFVINFKFAIPFTIVICIINSIGAFKMLNKEYDTIHEILIEQNKLPQFCGFLF